MHKYLCIIHTHHENLESQVILINVKLLTNLGIKKIVNDFFLFMDIVTSFTGLK